MNDHRPLHLRVRETIVALALDGCRDGDALPSVRALAAELDVNPLTVAKAYQSLLQTGIVEARRGIGFFIASGGVNRLRTAERAAFLTDEWPQILRQTKRLGLDVGALVKQAAEG